jgi:hypothetical protein
MSANGASPGGTSARGRAAGQLSIRASDLASALDLVPDMADGYAMYTDWSMSSRRSGRIGGKGRPFVLHPRVNG